MKSIYRNAPFAVLLVLGCSDNSPGTDGSGGTGSGGAAHGGASSGGASSGGRSASGGANGGTPAVSGGTGAGGAPQTQGGAVGTGGSSAGSSAMGGQSSMMGGSGGASTAGGKSGLGGGAAMGGKSAAGGGTASGGQSVGGGTSAQSAGCGKAPTIASSQYNNGQPISIMAANMQRRFVLNVPTNYDNTHPYRLVIAYHARDGNDKQMYAWQYYGLLPLSNNSTIFVAPNGQLNGAPCSGTSSSGQASCGWPNPNDSDLALADAVVALLEENFCIDKNRIFATGWSFGGSMSYRTACSRPEGGTASWFVRGIAVYSGAQLSGNCTPSKPVAYYHSHGTHDGVLNYDTAGMPLAQNFAKANGCTWMTPQKVTSGAHVCTNLMGCTTGYPLEFCSFNGDHTPFPDTGQSQGSWGPQEAWKFLSQF